MEHGAMPEGLELVRVTADFTNETVPDGLRRAHRVADGVWGRISVLAGEVRFVWEEEGSEAVLLDTGDSLVIPPNTPHHVEPADATTFHVEFYR